MNYLALAARQQHNAEQYPRVYPTPPFRPDFTFQDDIFRAPVAPGTDTLGFDLMDLREQGLMRTEEENLLEAVRRLRMPMR